MNKAIIPAIADLREEELKRAPLSLLDDAGTVFFWRGKVLRAVSAAAEEKTRALLASGLLEALVDRGWIPRWAVSGVRIQGYTIAIEQDLLPVVSYPYEWSYGMLRDAAARVLEINSLARDFGWELKDCHGFNIVFDGARPVWVDLGSFIRCPKEVRGWLAYEQFLCFYTYPLRIWADGGGFIARRMTAANKTMTHADFGLYSWPWLRFAGTTAYQHYMTRWHQRYRLLSRIPNNTIKSHLRAPVGAAICELKARNLLPFQNLSMQRLRREVLNRRRRGPAGYWSDYQGKGKAFVSTHRFQRIIELVQKFRLESVVELGGNQGWLSSELLRQNCVKLAICTDEDELAVDRAYERTKQSGGNLHTAVLDFVFPMTNPFGIPPPERLRADGALALAVSHHLLLSQAIPIDRMLSSIKTYANRIVFIEFMPLGLWNGTSGPPVPPWYTLEWFRAEFVRKFRLLHEESLEQNRYLFCGEVSSQ